MRGWRLQAIGVLGLVAMLTCACVTRSSKVARLTEDLQSDGVSVGFRAPMSRDELTANITDDESADRIIEWYRKTPRGSHKMGMRLQQALETKLMEDAPVASTRIETPHLRVTTLMNLVVLETRSSANGEWKQVAWSVRPEDKELCDWLNTQYGRELQIRNFESQKSELASPDAKTTVRPVSGQESEE